MVVVVLSFRNIFFILEIYFIGCVDFYLRLGDFLVIL